MQRFSVSKALFKRKRQKAATAQMLVRSDEYNGEDYVVTALAKLLTGKQYAILIKHSNTRANGSTISVSACV